MEPFTGGQEYTINVLFENSKNEKEMIDTIYQKGRSVIHKWIRFSMRLVYLFLFTLLLVSCGNGNKHDGNNKVKDSLKLMSYNIQHGVPYGGDTSKPNQVQLDSIAEVIKKANPDIVALQELDSVTERAPIDEIKKIGELTGMEYSFVKTIDYEGGAYGIGILSKYSIEHSERKMLPMTDSLGEQRAMAIVTIKLGDDLKIKFGSTHLDLKHENRMQQVSQMNEMADEEDLPLIIAGDFNSTPESGEIMKLKKNYTTLCKHNCPYTFSAKDPQRTIDYIILDKDKASKIFSSTKYEAVKNTLASDHLPLIAHFIIKK